MVKEYLQSYLNELLEKKINAERESSSLENRIRENLAFIELLEEKNEIKAEKRVKSKEMKIIEEN